MDGAVYWLWRNVQRIAAQVVQFLEQCLGEWKIAGDAYPLVLEACFESTEQLIARDVMRGSVVFLRCAGSENDGVQRGAGAGLADVLNDGRADA